jgi:hypothetical protein
MMLLLYLLHTNNNEFGWGMVDLPIMVKLKVHVAVRSLRVVLDKKIKLQILFIVWANVRDFYKAHWKYKGNFG